MAGGPDGTTLTPRENLFRVFRHERPEWIPLTGHVDNYNHPDPQGLPPAMAEVVGERGWWGTDANIAYARALEIDIAAWTAPPVATRFDATTIETREEGSDRIRTVRTPKGELREVFRKADDGLTGYILEHMVKGPDDLEALAAYFGDMRFSLDAEKLERVRGHAGGVGEGGMLVSPLPGTPLGMLIRVYAGPEAVAYLCADAPDELRALFAAMEENHRRKFLCAAEAPLDALVGMDDTSITTQSPAMFEQFNIEYTNRMADAVHGAGKLYWHHSCGLIREMLPLYRQTRMDAVHFLTEPPTGNVCIDEARETLGESIAMIPGLPAMTEPLAGREKTKAEIAAFFARGAPGHNLCPCMIAFQHLTMDEIRWIRDECRRHQEIA